MKPLLIAVTLFVLMVGCASAPPSAQEGDLEKRVQALLASLQKNHGFPGATVAYVLPDGSAGSTRVGLADVEAGTPMTPQTRMLAASIGKTFVGALVLSLEHDGVLSREDRVSEYLSDRPWFPRLPNASKISIAQLLTHSAGLTDHVKMDAAVRELIERGNEGAFRPEDAIALVLDKPPLFAAGSGWSYSDTGYLLIGLVIEAATGSEFYGLVEERFLNPLDLSETSPSVSRVLPGLAVGYTTKDNPFGLPARTMDVDGTLLWNPAVEWTGGGFVSTSHDLARWGHALFSGGAMDPPYLDGLLNAVPVHPDTPDVSYGSGVAIYRNTEFGTVYGHGGWVPGYVSSLRHYADHRLTIAFQINSDVGVVDDSTDLVPALEAALANLLLEKTQKN